MALTTLAHLHKGDHGIVRQVESPTVRIALMNMGILPGDEFELTDVAPRGCPMAIRVRGTKIAFRRELARSIAVEKA